MGKKVLYLLIAILFSGGTLLAQGLPKSDVYLGYSYVRVAPDTSGLGSINTHGGSASVSWNAHRYFGLVGEFGGYHGSKTFAVPGSTPVTLDGEVYTYMFGPRFTYRDSENSQRATPFAQILFGGAHANASFLGSSTSENSFAMSAGGGFDLRLTDKVSWRFVQVDYLLTRFNEVGTGNLNQNNVRVSTGIVFHF